MRSSPVLACQRERNLACLESITPGCCFWAPYGPPALNPAEWFWIDRLISRNCGLVICPIRVALRPGRSIRLPCGFRIRIPQRRGISNGVLEFCHTQTRRRDGVLSGTPAGLESITPRMRNLPIAGWLLKRVSTSVLAACETLCPTPGYNSSMTVKWAS